MEEIRRRDLYGNFYENEGKPLVIIIGGIQPGIPKISDDLLEYLKPRFNVLLLAYFGVGELQKTLDEFPVEYFIYSISAMKNRLKVSDKETILIGSNKGAEAVLLLISKYMNAGAAVLCTPSCYIWQTIPKNFWGILFPKSDWSFNNKPLPFIKFKYSVDLIKKLMNRSFVEIYLYSMKKNKVKEAFIDVSGYKGNMLLLTLEKEQYWPSNPMCKLIEQSKKEKIKKVVFDYDNDKLLEYKKPAYEIQIFLDEYIESLS